MRRTRGFYGGILVLFLGTATILAAAVAHGPDRDLTFERVTHSKLSRSELSQAFWAAIHWPKWFHQLKEAQVIDQNGQPYTMKDQFITAGSKLILKFEPPTKQWKRFEAQVEVLEYVPEHMIRILVLGDSGGKLQRIFGRLEWKVTLEDEPGGGTLIRGEALAHTAHWKSRLFGALTRQILMNQVFYPDLIALSKLEKIGGLNPLPPTQQ